MAIYTPDGTVIFTAEEMKYHHPWCNYGWATPREGCKMCERFYIKYPLIDDMMSYFPLAEVIE